MLTFYVAVGLARDRTTRTFDLEAADWEEAVSIVTRWAKEDRLVLLSLSLHPSHVIPPR